MILWPDLVSKKDVLVSVNIFFIGWTNEKMLHVGQKKLGGQGQTVDDIIDKIF